MRYSCYHSLLRIFALTLSFVLLFESGLLSPATKQLADNAGIYVANVIGVNAGVMPTEINTITAALTEQQRTLDAREAALSEREIKVTLGNTSEIAGSAFSTFILSVILFILLVLIVTNYVLDYLRSPANRKSEASYEQAA